MDSSRDFPTFRDRPPSDRVAVRAPGAASSTPRTGAAPAAAGPDEEGEASVA